ncbi:MAG: GAF domain-containing protein [Comamonadaceae bacterium]|nr:GAF domain-containing protein [Comamonadaceae bacterium]
MKSPDVPPSSCIRITPILINLRRALSGESFTVTIEFRGRFSGNPLQIPPARTSEDVALLGVATDITERVLIERVLRNRGISLNSSTCPSSNSRRMSISIRETSPSRTGVITEAAVRAMMTERTSIWFYTDDQTGIRCADLYELIGTAFSGYILRASQYPAYFRALLEGTVIDAHDARSDPHQEFTESYLLPLGIQSMLDVPIRVSSSAAGVVCHEHVGQERITDKESRASSQPSRASYRRP